jgi:hypothetical protein
LGQRASLPERLEILRPDFRVHGRLWRTVTSQSIGVLLWNSGHRYGDSH